MLTPSLVCDIKRGKKEDKTYRGKTISTPMPAMILRIRIVVWIPAFCLDITIPL